MKKYYLYIIADKKNGKLLIDITDKLSKTILEINSCSLNKDHEMGSALKLVYFEETHNVVEAIRLKKKIDKWDNIWKIILIEKVNPEWKDLFEEIILIENLTKNGLITCIDKTKIKI